LFPLQQLLILQNRLPYTQKPFSVSPIIQIVYSDMLNCLCLCWLVTVAKVIGFIYLIRAAITVLKHIRTAMVRLTPEWASKYGLGSWAVVTGCTEGIGKGFCYVLAPLRINLCLVSRNKAKLEALEAELKAKFSRLQTKIVVADFSESSPAFYDRVIAEIGDIDVSILVNNVGMAYLGNSQLM
jgi:17beta-estradiol 17-dehydrogenase / very-long-chain 3-oxoacyl-CoA reductase